ncbi:MAG: DUF4111 domain-containing protein [Clostridia bacterium]|nr:DUF4111 domain-containing protein [Clostridia bacterium]
MNERELLQHVCLAYQKILGKKLVGFYVHGSIAFGCFHWATGDIDFLAMVGAPLRQDEKEALIRLLLDLSDSTPPKGFEMSVILQQVCNPFVYPTPFELHFSNTHKSRAEADLPGFCRTMNGTDPDLAAHVTVLHSAGLTLYGQAIPAVFGEVPRACYVDSILADVNGAAAEIADNPVYITLNLCRVLAYVTDGAVLSKEQGGSWGLSHLPQAYHPLLSNALGAYRGTEGFTQTTLLSAFAADMTARIRTAQQSF